ncbi:hypothetical protein [Agrobacterium pusense]|uniref:hypothetical protein n=1 Tax=Agrobacterium pusense TaxID=648995 RepID=UPI000D3717D3|nr:hypothetical protein [Agrobacterium pusense]PTV70235.1 hypothetical protein DBL06_25565 [Agrobacterium pusense]
MEAIINDTLRATAAAIDALMASASEELAGIVARLQEMDEIERLEPNWRSAEHTFAFYERAAQKRFVSNMLNRAENIFDDVKSTRESVGRSIGSFAEDLETAQRNLDQARDRAATERAIEKAKDIERIDSGFKFISSFKDDYGRGKNGFSIATVLFMIDGVLFQAQERFNKKARTFDRAIDLIGLDIKNRTDESRHNLFTANMSDEEIAKAADCRDKIVIFMRRETGF